MKLQATREAGILSQMQADPKAAWPFAALRRTDIVAAFQGREEP